MENIIGLMIYLAVASFMTGIGISQLRSKKPVAFYSGEKPPGEEELSDVKAWNQNHGRMWVLYGLIILVSYGIGVIIGDTLWCVIPMCGGVVFPLPFMIMYHHKLVKLYRKERK